MNPPLLEVRDLSVRFGRLEALRAVSLEVPAGSVVGLIGPNGAGKTTLIHAVAGSVPLTSGTVRLDGTPIEGRAPHQRARLGVGRTFQSLELFEDLDVAENLRVAAEATRFSGSHPPDAAGRVTAAAAFVGLGNQGDGLPPALSHAERARVALGRALAAQPRLLLLDEPAAGLDAGERAALAERLRHLAERGLGMLVVDHDMAFLLGLCDHVWVLDAGRVIAHGPPAAVRGDPAVISAYLGMSGPPSASAEPRAPTTGPVLLDVRGVSAGYGAGAVIDDVNLDVSAGEVVALLGANGAGKTTTLRAACGVLPLLAGEVEVFGAPVGRRLDRLARRGLAYVPQGRALFPGLTVREHLRLAGAGRGGRLDGVLGRFPALRSLLDRRAGHLSGGEQQLLAMARALAGPHRLIVVDEASLGLAPLLVEQLFGTLREAAAAQSVGVLVVEQHARVALASADRAYVMHAGRMVIERPAAELVRRPELLAAAYLQPLPVPPTP